MNNSVCEILINVITYYEVKHYCRKAPKDEKVYMIQFQNM